MKKCLNRDMIKYVAIFAMLLDHIAWMFLPFSSATAQVFHTVGRITAPIMCFFIAEGYHYTRDIKKYALRLFIFAAVSQVPWWLMHGEMFTLSFSMITTLLLSLAAIFVYDNIKNPPAKIFLLLALFVLSMWCDWMYFAPLWCLGFHKYRENEPKKYLWLAFVNLLYFLYTVFQFLPRAGVTLTDSLTLSLYSLGSFLAMPLLLLYNGEKGKYKNSKWVFYVFYPLHILVLVLIKNYIVS